MESQQFEALPLPHKNFPQAGMGTYRVYSDDKNFVMVSAMNAIEALAASKMEQVIRIQRDSLDLTTVFSPKDWTKDAGSLSNAAPEAEMEKKDLQPINTVEVPLSNDDVENLLKN